MPLGPTQKDQPAPSDLALQCGGHETTSHKTEQWNTAPKIHQNLSSRAEATRKSVTHIKVTEYKFEMLLISVHRPLGAILPVFLARNDCPKRQARCGPLARNGFIVEDRGKAEKKTIQQRVRLTGSLFSFAALGS